MQISGLTASEFAAVVERVSRELYDGNLTVWDSAPSALNRAGNRFRQRLRVRDSRGRGARRSWSGRRQPAACWHTVRDVVRATLAQYPGAVFRTAYAVYDAETFEERYPRTGTINVGSLAQPVTMPDLCECDEHAHAAPRRLPVTIAGVY